MPTKNVLVATDGSPSADRAVDFAAALSRALDATLIVMTVQEGLPSDAVKAFKSIEHVGEAEVAELTATGVLNRARLRAEHAGAGAVRTLAEAGDPTQRILEAAAREGAVTVVVGKRGRGPLAALLLGSVSQKLVSLASCPIVVVP